MNFTYYFNKLRDAEKDYLREKRERAEVPDNALMETSWAAIITLFGEERITQSMNRGFGNAEATDYGIESEEEEYEPKDEDNEEKNFVWDDEPFGVDPLDAVIRRENREMMLAAMTDKQHKVFVLYHKYGYTQCEIAEILGVSRATVRERLDYTTKKAKIFF